MVRSVMTGQEPVLGAPVRATLEAVAHFDFDEAAITAEAVIGRLRVVLTEEETSSAEIVTLEGPVFHVGTTTYLGRKMR